MTRRSPYMAGDLLDDRAITALNAEETTALAECEAIIAAGFDTFVEVGLALAAVKDRRLYRAQFGSFEAYLARRWEISRSRAHRLIEAADLVLALPIGNRPANEAQARELAKVPEADRADVLREATERGNGKPTAATIAEVRREREQPSTSAGQDLPPIDSPAVPAASERQAATDPPLQERPGPDRPAGRDLEKPPAEAVGSAVATTGQPGPEPYVAWRDSFAADLARTRAITVYRTPAEVARCADTELVDQLRHVVAEVTEFLSDVEAVLAAD